MGLKDCNNIFCAGASFELGAQLALDQVYPGPSLVLAQRSLEE